MKYLNKLKTKTKATHSWLKSAGATFATVATVMLCMTVTGCKKEEEGKTSGAINYKGDVYTVSIGEIETAEAGYISIELLGNMKGYVEIVKGGMIPDLGMRILVDGRTLEYESGSISPNGRYVYYFKTTKKPEKIIVYSNDDGKATLTFDGKSKKLIK